jgi:hypothetical protein
MHRSILNLEIIHFKNLDLKMSNSALFVAEANIVIDEWRDAFMRSSEYTELKSMCKDFEDADIFYVIDILKNAVSTVFYHYSDVEERIAKINERDRFSGNEKIYQDQAQCS